jgi:NDP-sugar pyrophosphorylase family protein
MLPAIVLTAGLGTRLDPLTRLVAKPAVPLGRLSLIERVLAWVRQQDVTDVVLNLHHRPASLTAIVGDGTHLGLRVRYSGSSRSSVRRGDHDGPSPSSTANWSSS